MVLSSLRRITFYIASSLFLLSSLLAYFSVLLLSPFCLSFSLRLHLNHTRFVTR